MIDFNNTNEVYNVYGVYPHHDNSTHHMLLGRFVVHNGELRILEDHNGLLGGALKNGPVDENEGALRRLQHSSYLKVVSESEVKDGHHIDLLPKGQEAAPDQPQAGSPPASAVAPPQSVYEEPAPFAMQSPPPVFDYLEAGMTTSQIVEIRGDQIFLNGRQLSQEGAEHLLYRVRTGLAKLKYKKGSV